jgi:hypothetical protein
MMSKLTTICAALLLIISSSANAVLTTDTVTDSMALDTGWLGPDAATYNWTQTWIFDLPPVYVNSATLDIVAFDVSVSQGDIIPVTLDGINLGNLVQGNTNQWNTSSFSLSSSALAELTDESATISVTVPSGKQIKIETSTLTIDYTLSTVFADYGSGTTTQLFAGGAVWQLNWGQGPWTWSDSTDQPLLDSNVSAVLDLLTTGAADVSADLVATLPIAGTLTLTAHDEHFPDVTTGTMVLSGAGINVIDINASRVIVDEGSGMFLAPFHPPGPKVTLALEEATGVFGHITQVGPWDLSFAGSYAIPLIEGLELQDNIMTALGGNVALIGGIGEFALSGLYTPNQAKLPIDFCQYGTGSTEKLAPDGGGWNQQWGLGPWDWLTCTAETNAQFLNENVTGSLTTQVTGLPNISEDLILHIPLAGQQIMTEHAAGNPDEVIGQITCDVIAMFVADMNAQRATINEAEGTITIAFGASVEEGPDGLMTVTEATGSLADIRQVSPWEWHVNGTMQIARVPELSVQDNLLAALQQAELLLGAEEEFALSGSYYRSSP